MDLALTDEQAMIRDAAADVLAERSASADVRRALEQSAGRDDALWAALAGELGWNALSLPEAAGGMGLGAIEQTLLMEQLGRRVACVPYFSTACLAATALAGCSDAPLATGWLAKIAEGACSATLALPFELPAGAGQLPVVAEEAAGGYALSGTIEQVIDGARADLLVIPARIANEGQSTGLFAIDVATASGLTITPLDTLDATRPIARIVLDEIRVSRDARFAGGAVAAQVLERAAWFAALTLAAEQLGGAQQCLDLTLDYTGQRVQFGRAIASFQAVKHRCAQMMVLIESARSAVLGAAHAWDAEAGGAAPGAALRADIAAAKAAANDAYAFCAQEAIQLHGGVGFTWEYDPHLYFKRAQASLAQFGSTPQLLEWIARHAIDGGASGRDAALALPQASTAVRPSAARTGALQ
ncbi:acyl-CoA dehydrogenase [Burkholderia diffusa]|uniref:Acyl-CoA dehydrogenase n=1 Tax=Burkholderia diffusa TaxID=488732 RepID=A0AAW3PKQ8_9BURK|nr:acyl-CoA dehydrogenase family protein [Burkholderia diffusa]KWF27284.1 acyl-CoA dehydrogenase [Burkholderia diffusa]KWF43697.1 acyl-CoA dehydrogenase [Burkholderia diffusa]KWF54556.1 acyl-CoA dehydrogenase [Burkholderia diffusa]KWF57433.1 acyl-CoA dehydrogenase [Burkholderia diffusa]